MLKTLHLAIASKLNKEQRQHKTEMWRLKSSKSLCNNNSYFLLLCQSFKQDAGAAAISIAVRNHNKGILDKMDHWTNKMFPIPASYFRGKQMDARCVIDGFI